MSENINETTRHLKFRYISICGKNKSDFQGKQMGYHINNI